MEQVHSEADRDGDSRPGVQDGHAGDVATGDPDDRGGGEVALDLDFVRAQFPAFGQPSLEGWIHAQNAGGSWACSQVIDRLTTFYLDTKVQGGDHFPAGAAGLAAQDRARPALARWLGVAPDEVHIGPSTAANTTALAAAFGEALGPGDAAIVTNLDHEANSGAWRGLAARGVQVREWQVDTETASLSLDDLDALLDDDVALVAFPHVSNIVGRVLPVADIADRAHAVGAVAIADGVAAAPHAIPDVDALGVDVYLFSTYKTFGPHQGVTVVRRDLAQRLPNQGPFFYDDVPEKWFLPAGPDHAQVAAIVGVTAYLDGFVDHHLGSDLQMPDRRRRLTDVVAAHEARLLAPILDLVRDRPGVDVVGTADAITRVPTLSLVTEKDPAMLAAALADHRIMAASGHFHAWRLVEALGIEPTRGVLRLSLVHYNTPDESRRIVEGLDAVL